MVQAKMIDLEGKEMNMVDLPLPFASAIRNDLMHKVVVAQLANKRQGTHSTKTRDQVAGGGKKPWRQKGTGRARQGSIRSPQWRGGGVVFGPHPRDYRQDVPKKIRKAAIVSALSAKAAEGRVIVAQSMPDFEKPSTKTMVNYLKNAGIQRTCLIVLGARDENTVLSARNLQGIKTINVASLNVYDLLRYKDIVITQGAIEKVAEVWS